MPLVGEAVGPHELGKTGERPGTWPERVVTAVAGVGRLNGYWGPGHGFFYLFFSKVKM